MWGRGKVQGGGKVEGGESGWDAMYERRIKNNKRKDKNSQAYKNFCINAKSKLTILGKIFVNVQFLPFH